ncbi:MAG: OmpA family protein [Desulfovibrio sp.]|nr:OmpA family protein [Desulfovibrio sp.]MBI4960028.1 OmpA family protein [Desulfovibrio sp.]
MSANPDPVGEELDDPHAGPPIVWLISLADMSMLLMSFFIFMFSLSTTDPAGVTETLESVRERLRSESKSTPKTPAAQSLKEKVVEQMNMREQLILRERQVYEDLTAFFRGRGETNMRTKLDGPRLTISVPTAGMFSESDVTQLTDLGKQRITTIKDFMAKHPDQRVHIKGFTDDTPPPPQSRFKNNWEVSSLQAVAALRFLMSQGVPSNRLTSTGLADLEPLLPNTSDENRARNRRLDFVLEVQVEG